MSAEHMKEHAAAYSSKLQDACKQMEVAAIYIDDGAPYDAADCLERAVKALHEAGAIRNEVLGITP